MEGSSQINWLSEAESLRAELVSLRHRLHRCPEPGNQEYKTHEIIRAALSSYDVAVTPVLDTGLLGSIGEGGPVAALRADMDGLSVSEATGASFSSENPGMMHACGHDVHMAAVVGAAMLLNRHKDRLKGSVRFLFQPDEEGNGGAQRMISAGCLDGVSAVFGAHVSPELPLGAVGLRYGKFYAASDTFAVKVTGKASHGAEPEKGRDAVLAAAHMLCALNELPRQFPQERAVLTSGLISGGTAINVLADYAEFSGIIRTLGEDSRRKMKELFTRTVNELAGEHGVELDIALHESYPGVVNHDGEVRLVQETALKLLGADRVKIIEQPTMTTEDFGYFLQKAGGCFYHIGAGCEQPLHNPRFLPEDDAVIYAAALHAAVIETYLMSH